MAKEPTKAQKDEAKALKIRVTKEENGKRVSKTAAELTKEISEAKAKRAEDAKAKAAKEKAEADAAVAAKAEADAKAAKEKAEAEAAQDEADEAEDAAAEAKAEAEAEAEEAQDEATESQDTAEINAFRKAAIGRRWNMHNLIHEAYARFGEENVSVDKNNNNQVRFEINGQITPEEGYFTVI